MNKPKHTTKGTETPDGTDNVTDLDSVRRSRNGEAQTSDKASDKASSTGEADKKPAKRVKNRRFDKAKVERLKAAIADGSYTIDAERVADKFIEHDRK